MNQESNRDIVATEAAGTTLSSWVGTLLFFAFPLLLFIGALKSRDPAAIAITGFFLLIGIVVLVVHVQIVLQVRKYGDVRLRLEQPDPATGGRLLATIALPPRARAPLLRAELACTRVRYDEKDKSNSTRDWARMVPVKARAERIAISIGIPANMHGSSSVEPTDLAREERVGKYFWKWELHLKTEVPGLDFSRHYLIPVEPPNPGTTTVRNPLGATVASHSIAGQQSVPAPAATSSLPVASSGTMPNPVAAASMSSTVTTAKPVQIASAEASPFPLWLLVLGNLVPIAGSVLWGWKAQELVFLYWMENLVIGAFTVLRIAVVVPDASDDEARGVGPQGWELALGKALIIVFFLAHYGGFCFGHGIFLGAIFAPRSGPDNPILNMFATLLPERGMVLALLAIVCVHAVAFARFYPHRLDCSRDTIPDLMMRPYKRVFVTHAFILLGAIPMVALKSPVPAMVLFIAIKIAVDVMNQRREEAGGARPS